MKQLFQKFSLSLIVLLLTATFCSAQKSKQPKTETLQDEVENAGFQCSDREKSEELYFEIL